MSILKLGRWTNVACSVTLPPFRPLLYWQNEQYKQDCHVELRSRLINRLAISSHCQSTLSYYKYGNTDAQLPGRIPPPLCLYPAPTNVTLCKQTTSQWPVNKVENTEPSLRLQHRISPTTIVLHGLPPRVVQRDILPHYKTAGGSCASHDGLLPERGGVSNPSRLGPAARHTIRHWCSVCLTCR